MKTPQISMKLFRIFGITVLLIIAAHSVLYQNLFRRNITHQIFLRGADLAYPLWQQANQLRDQGNPRETLERLSNQCTRIKEISGIYWKWRCWITTAIF